MDQYICAEIPDLPADPRSKDGQRQKFLYDIVTSMMLHMCSADRCKQDGRNCSKRFPVFILISYANSFFVFFQKPYSEYSQYIEGTYPIYKRRPPPPKGSGNTCKKMYNKKEYVFANDRVVSYNPFLTAKYGSQYVYYLQ